MGRSWGCKYIEGHAGKGEQLLLYVPRKQLREEAIKANPGLRRKI
ncbi:MAG: hypothetical protein TQ35_0006655 [Candidatus Aramenus sulfurataquae]|uniref:Uncharacterized protein n=1 Tax=Candidatus Aramenus sulfurataquae TaxID=1326980 RepID=A0ACC6TPS1_9CREN